MANFGDYTKTTYINTSVPAINQTNLNNIENKMNLVDEELRRSQTFRLSDYLDTMYQCNTKEIEDFQDSTEWTMAVGGTISNDTTNYLIHKQSVKILEPDNTAGYLCMHKACSLNLALFPNGGASSADDLILLVVYISDVAALTHVYFKLGTNNTDNYYLAIPAASLSTGWNFISTAKSAFSENNPPNWNNITYIRCEWYSNASQVNEYVSFQYAQLIREDSASAGYYNPFQLYSGAAWENLFSIIYDYYLLYYDKKYNKLCIQTLNPGGIADMLHLNFCDRSNFIFKAKMTGNTSFESQNLVWYVDDDNYIQVGIYGNDLEMTWRETAGNGWDEIELDESFLPGDDLELTLEKNGSTVRAIAKVNGKTKTLERVTTIVDEGCLYLGSLDYESFSLVEDLILTHTQGFQFPEKNTYYKVKNTASTINNSDAYTADPELFLILPKGVWEVEFNIGVYNATSDTPDFKTDWLLTNCTEISFRSCSGPARSVTDANDTNMQARRISLTTGIGYGVSTQYVNITEKGLIQITENTGTVTLRRGQYTANASNTIVENKSYVIARKIN